MMACPVCGSPQPLELGGTLAGHRAPGSADYCPGSGLTRKQAEAADVLVSTASLTGARIFRTADGAYGEPPLLMRPGSAKLGSMSASVAEVLEPFGDAELIPLPELTRHLPGDLNRYDVARAKRRGVLTVAPKHGPNGRDQVTRDEAASLIVAAIISALAGIALATALQAVKAAGITPAAIGAGALAV